MQMQNQVIVAVNPRAGANGAMATASELCDHLGQRQIEATIESDIEAICLKSEETLKNGRLRAVVAAGGDGTASLLANRLPPQAPLALLPLGTENLLAKYLKTSADPQDVATVIADGRQVHLDAGEANGKLFLVMASCGFDADVVRQLHARRTGHIRHWSYAKPIFNSIRKYRYPTISIQCDKRSPIKAKWAFIFNAPRYAMGLPIADDADAMDGDLDLCAFRGGNLLNGLVYLMGVLARRHRRWRDTHFLRAKRLVLQAHEEVPYQLDGDPGGFLPLEIKVLPKRLRVLVPRAWAHAVNTLGQPAAV